MKKYLYCLLVLLIIASGCSSSSSSKQEESMQSEQSQQPSEVVETTENDENPEFIMDTYHELLYFVSTEWEELDNAGKDQKGYVSYSEDGKSPLFMLSFVIIDGSDLTIDELYKTMKVAASKDDSYTDVKTYTNEDGVDFVLYDYVIDDSIAMVGEIITQENHYMVSMLTDPNLKAAAKPFFESILSTIMISQGQQASNPTEQALLDFGFKKSIVADYPIYTCDIKENTLTIWPVPLDSEDKEDYLFVFYFDDVEFIQSKQSSKVKINYESASCTYSFTDNAFIDDSPSACGENEILIAEKVKELFDALLEEMNVSREDFLDLMRV